MEAPAIAALLVDSPSREENPAGAAVEKSIGEMTRGMRHGDSTAWEIFHRRYFFALQRAAVSMSRSVDAEAAVQAAYLRVARHIKPFRDEQSLWRWLCCILRCVVVDLQRERVRTNHLLERFHLWNELRRSSTHPPFRDDGLTALEEAMEALSEDDSALLRRKYCEGWSSAELALHGNCTEKAIEGRLARLRGKLKKQLLGGNPHA